MNRSTGRAPKPAVATIERRTQIACFFGAIRILEHKHNLHIAGDGLEIHDDETGTYPAIITEDGRLEMFTEQVLEAANA